MLALLRVVFMHCVVGMGFVEIIYFPRFVRLVLAFKINNLEVLTQIRRHADTQIGRIFPRPTFILSK
jgi:hypothetical protein